MNDTELINMLSSDKFDPPYEAIAEMKKQKGVSDKVLEHILKLEDNLVVGEFLEQFIYLSNEQLEPVREYIQLHLNDRDSLFVSCLIESANVNSLMSFYDDFLNIIRTRINDYVVLAALDFIFENLQFDKINDIVRAFRRVINNKKHYQNSQVVASFYLFRITMDKEYLVFLRELVLELGDINHVVLENILTRLEYNHQKYFKYHNELMELVNERKNSSLSK